jgi:hypothetical protein
MCYVGVALAEAKDQQTCLILSEMPRLIKVFALQEAYICQGPFR